MAIHKPSELEDEYIARQEFERKKKQEEEKRKELDREERARLKDLHFMRCPKCGMELIEVKYKSVDIDQCSNCHGVWLDAGELDAVAEMEKGALDKLFTVFKGYR
jgi:ribosomal protein L37AE/L43A